MVANDHNTYIEHMHHFSYTIFHPTYTNYRKCVRDVANQITQSN